MGRQSVFESRGNCQHVGGKGKVHNGPKVFRDRGEEVLLDPLARKGASTTGLWVVGALTRGQVTSMSGA